MALQSFSLHPPSEEARQTIESIMVENVSMKLLPTHCINAAGELEGFMLNVPDDAKGAILPTNRSMFHGTSLFEVNSARASVFNEDIMRLQQTANTKEAMQQLMQKITAQARGHEANFRCMPDSLDIMSSVKTDGGVMEGCISRTTGRRNVDFGSWQPELPYSIGLYQAFCRGYQKDTRVHKLFIGISGGLNKCSDEFYNMLLDVGNEFTCKEIAQSEEAWWLRKACQRARARLAVLTAEHFDLKVTTVQDLFAFDQEVKMGVPVTDTIEYDIKEGPNRTVEFYSACIDTTSIQNGILTRMHPSEGLWIFRGSAKSSAKVTSFGSLFGSKNVCGVFPTRSPCYKRNQGSPACVNGLDSDLVVRYNPGQHLAEDEVDQPRKNERVAPDGFVYQCFDERFMSKLSDMQWDRNCGVTELVPIVVGLG